MIDRRPPTLNKVPFYLADLVLIVLAICIFKHYPHPLPLGPALLIVGCVGGAAYLGVLPFRLQYQAEVRFAEASELAGVTEPLENLQSIAEQIRSATAQWQTAHEHSTKSVTAAKEISDRMASEAKSFADFMRKANDAEKAALRLETEKLRRGEGQWLQLVVHLLDHVFALYQAGARSGQPNLEAQLGNFQEACRELVRRVGLLPFEARANEGFDPARHQVVEGEPDLGADAVISQTLAVGYTFQGQLLRRAVVAIQPTVQTSADAFPGVGQNVIGEAGATEADFLSSEPQPEVATSEARRADEELAEVQEFRLEPEDLRRAETRETRP